MKRNLIAIWVILGIFSSGLVFWWNNLGLVNNQSNIPRIYNPISWFYEQKSKEEIEWEIQQEKAKKIDYYSDDSFQKFLDDNHPLSANYSANDVVKINSDFTSNRSSDFMLRKKAAEMY